VSDATAAPVLLKWPMLPKKNSLSTFQTVQGCGMSGEQAHPYRSFSLFDMRTRPLPLCNMRIAYIPQRIFMHPVQKGILWSM